MPLPAICSINGDHLLIPFYTDITILLVIISVESFLMVILEAEQS